MKLPEPTVVIVGENNHHADELYCWLWADENDNEGIVAAYSNFGWAPLVFAVEKLAREQEGKARDVADTLRAHGQKVKVRLVKFTRGATLKEL